MRRIIIFFVALSAISFVACGLVKKEELVITGSETMHHMMEVVAEEYMKKNPQVSIKINGGGSLVGIKGLLENKADIAVSSKELSIDEFNKLELKNKNLEVITIAYDGMAVVVNKANKIEKITLSELSDIYSGKITKWKAIGGNEEDIDVIVRNDNSGTSYFFKMYVLRKKYLGLKAHAEFINQEYVSTAKGFSYNNEIANYIKEHPNAIGYMGMGSANVENHDKIKVLKFARTKEGPYILPDLDSVFKQKYKLNRSLYMIYKPDNGMKKDKFSSFVLSKEGQEAILRSGYLKSTMEEVEVKGSVE